MLHPNHQQTRKHPLQWRHQHLHNPALQNDVQSRRNDPHNSLHLVLPPKNRNRAARRNKNLAPRKRSHRKRLERIIYRVFLLEHSTSHAYRNLRSHLHRSQFYNLHAPFNSRSIRIFNFHNKHHPRRNQQTSQTIQARSRRHQQIQYYNPPLPYFKILILIVFCTLLVKT